MTSLRLVALQLLEVGGQHFHDECVAVQRSQQLVATEQHGIVKPGHIHET